MLRIIQLNTLEDRSVNDKRDWDRSGNAFLGKICQGKVASYRENFTRYAWSWQKGTMVLLAESVGRTAETDGSEK